MTIPRSEFSATYTRPCATYTQIWGSSFDYVHAVPSRKNTTSVCSPAWSPYVLNNLPNFLVIYPTRCPGSTLRTLCPIYPTHAVSQIYPTHVVSWTYPTASCSG